MAKFKQALKRCYKSMIEARQKSANHHIAMMHLHRMTDKELRDIGICRGDINRVVRFDI